MSANDSVRSRYAEILERIEHACRRAGRDPGSVTLVGASKRQPPERLHEAYEAGLRVFGENIVQEAEAHQEELARDDVQWHLIGPLQSNKSKRAVELFSTVEAVDRLKIARYLDRHAGEAGKRLRCFLEVNLDEEDSKAGFRPDGFAERIAPIAELEHLEVVGLMAIPPFEDDPEASRPWFVKLRRLAEELGRDERWSGFPGLLSMGMSNDFEVAIEEGATHVRVGTALFGSRTS